MTKRKKCCIEDRKRTIHGIIVGIKLLKYLSKYSQKIVISFLKDCDKSLNKGNVRND